MKPHLDIPAPEDRRQLAIPVPQIQNDGDASDLCVCMTRKFNKTIFPIALLVCVGPATRLK